MLSQLRDFNSKSLQDIKQKQSLIDKQKAKLSELDENILMQQKVLEDQK